MKLADSSVSWKVVTSQPTESGPSNLFLKDTGNIHVLAVIPFFNEEPEDLYMTLCDLHINERYIRKHGYVDPKIKHVFHAMIVMDGYNKASARTIEWCKNMFPGDPWKVLEHLRPNKKESPQTVEWFKSKQISSLQDGDKTRREKVAKQIITDDKSYADELSDPLKEYAIVFQTSKNNILSTTRVTPPTKVREVVTKYSHVFEQTTCSFDPCDIESPAPEEAFDIPLTLIVKIRNRQKHDSHWWTICPNGFVDSYLESKYAFFTDCGTLFDKAAMFHMLAEIQKSSNIGAVTGRQRVMNAAQQNATGEGFISEVLRHVQRCDFELSFATSVGAFSLAGCLPVLPGPCGLYRRDVIVSGAGEFYHSFLSMNPEKIGLIEANVMIAEDRVLSISPFFAQTDLGENMKDMITTVAPDATFYYESENSIMPLIKQRRRWINGTIASYLWLLYKHPLLVAKSFNISLWRRVLLYWLFFVQTYTFLFVFICPSIFLGLFRVAVRSLSWKASLYSEWWFIIFLGLYVLFVWASAHGNATDWMIYIGMIIGVIIEVLTITGLTIGWVSQGLDNTTNIPVNATGYVGNYSWIDLTSFGLLVATALLPLIGAFFASPKSFMYIMRSGVYFMLFLPTLVGIFGIYSISNFSDFSWGNRDSSGSADKLGARLNTLIARGKFFGFIFLAINFSLIFVSIDLYDNKYWKLFGAIAIFAIPLTSIALSTAYWIVWRLYDISMRIVGVVTNKTLKLEC